MGSIQAIPICCHMNLYSPTLTRNFDLPWPLRPLCDLLDIFFQLQNIQLNRFINGAPWYMAKTCATGFQNLGCYVAKTTFYFIEEPIVRLMMLQDHLFSREKKMGMRPDNCVTNFPTKKDSLFFSVYTRLFL